MSGSAAELQARLEARLVQESILADLEELVIGVRSQPKMTIEKAVYARIEELKKSLAALSVAAPTGEIKVGDEVWAKGKITHKDAPTGAFLVEFHDIPQFEGEDNTLWFDPKHLQLVAPQASGQSRDK